MDNLNLVEDFLTHHGVKGMKWGVHRDRESSSLGSSANTPESSSQDHRKLKTAGLVLGSAAAVALVAGGAYYLSKNGNLPLSSISQAQKSAGKKFVDETISASVHEPTGIIHATGHKYGGDWTRRRGGLSDVFPELVKSGIYDEHASSPGHGHYRRYGSNLEKVGVIFKDPKGRMDFAGRPILHNIVLPRHHTQDITNFEQARDKAWSLVKDDYEKFWQHGLNKDVTKSEARRLGLMD